MEHKHGFLKGFLTGCAAAALCLSAVGLAVLSQNREWLQKPEEESTTAAGQEGELAELEQRMSELQQYIDENYVFEYNKEDVDNAVLKAMVDGMGDIYSTYFTADEYKEQMESSSGEYYGIGVLVTQNTKTMQIIVLNVFSTSPAKEAGIQKADIITGVDGQDVTQMELTDVVAMIKGQQGSTVDVTIYRPEEDQTHTYTVERRKVQVDTVESRMLDDNTGYISLLQFEDVSCAQMKAAIDSLKEQGMTDLVLDLRDNPGGLLSSVLDIADLFLNKNDMIFYMENKAGNTYRYYAEEDEYFSGKMIVLINGNSASASEVLSGALKDHGRAVLMGETSFGKGIVQTFFPLEDGSAIKLTTHHYCTPSGTDIHGKGIDPDIEDRDDPDTPDTDELVEDALEQLD